jgi:hypothetical protein
MYGDGPGGDGERNGNRVARSEIEASRDSALLLDATETVGPDRRYGGVD